MNGRNLRFYAWKNFVPFMLVGLLATATHYGVAVLAHYGVQLLSPFGLTQLSATASNCLGFVAAFPISYLGHRYWTFHQTKVRHKQAISKFLSIALLNFMINQTIVWLGLNQTSIPFWLLLAVVLAVMPVITYVLSQYWVFKTHVNTDSCKT